MVAKLFSRTLSNFGRKVPLDDIFAFYAHLGLSKEQANLRQAGAELLAAAWAVFSDGEIDLPLASKPLDRRISAIFGPERPTQGSFYRALEAERRNVEQHPTSLSPAFEILQLHWGAHLASKLATQPEILDRLAWYWRVRKGGILFGAGRSGPFLTTSQRVSLSPLRFIVEIEPGIRGAFAVQSLYDSQLAPPLLAPEPFQYLSIHRNDFHAQCLYMYADTYGQFLSKFWRNNKDKVDTSLKRGKEVARWIHNNQLVAATKGHPAEEIKKMVNTFQKHGAGYEIVDLIVWASRSVLAATEQEVGEIIRQAQLVLRSGNGMLIGVPLLPQPETAHQVLQKVEAIAKDIFGEQQVSTYPDTGKPLVHPMSYVFLQK